METPENAAAAGFFHLPPTCKTPLFCPHCIHSPYDIPAPTGIAPNVVDSQCTTSSMCDAHSFTQTCKQGVEKWITFQHRLCKISAHQNPNSQTQFPKDFEDSKETFFKKFLWWGLGQSPKVFHPRNSLIISFTSTSKAWFSRHFFSTALTELMTVEWSRLKILPIWGRDMPVTSRMR